MNPRPNSRGDHFFTRQEHVGEPGAEPDFSRFVCTHEKQAGPATITVLGWAINIMMPSDMPMCRSCYEAYFNTYATLCGCCGKPILPGEWVAEVPCGTTTLPNKDQNRSSFMTFVQPIVDLIRAFMPNGRGGLAECTARVTYQLTHHTVACAGYLDRLCGRWGQGRLISLHELMPNEVPPGTRTMTGLNFALNGGEQPPFVGFGDK